MPEGTPTRHQMPMQMRLASFQPTTYNAQERTVELTWSAGGDVRRYDFWSGTYYIERLSMDPAAVNLSRLNSGAALLNSHQTYDLSGQIGVVERAWLDGNEGKALVRFSQRDDVLPILKDVQDGIIRNVSVGYMVGKIQIEQRQGQDPIYTAVDWTPTEISLVTVPADPNASVRSAGSPEHRMNECEFINRAAAHNPKENETMTTQTTGGTTASTTQAVIDPTVQDRALEAARAEGQRQERERISQIRQAAQNLNLEAQAETLISEGVTIDTARARLIDLAAEQSRANRVGTIQQTDHPSGDDPSVKLRAMAEGLASQYQRRITPSEQAREYSEFRLSELAAEFLTVHGVRSIPRNALRRMEMAMNFRAGPMTTSDFSSLLLDSANKVMMPEYQAMTPSYRKIAAKKTFNDFKPTSFLRLGDFPSILQVGESGEFKTGAMKDSKEQITLATYGRVITLTRAAIVNDDMGGFADIALKAGRRIADFENAMVFAVIAQGSGVGPTMSDGVVMFHSTHANKAASGTVIDVTNIGAGQAAMQKQAGLTDTVNDKSTTGIKLNLQPKFILTSPDKFLTAWQAIAPINPATAGNTNPYSGAMEVISDANLSGNGWYLFADPAQAEALVYGYLAGNEGPRFTTRDGFTTSGMDFKLELDFAAGAADYKPAYFNAGA